MSRAKPYDRSKRDLDSQWKHDLHESRSLSSRLVSKSPASGNASPSLLNRLSRGSGRGKELLPESSGRKMHGFDSNAGVELLPSSSKSARSTRGSRARGGQVDPGQRALVANGLAAITGRGQKEERERVGESLSIVGAAAGSVWVRVERLAKGTTAEDVKSAFSSHPIAEARVTSRAEDRTVTIELELPDRDTANALVKEYDGVAADGETLRVTVLRKGGNGGARSELSARMSTRASPRQQEQKPQRPGKMYSDLMEDAPPPVVVRQEQRGPLAARLGRR